MATLERLTGFMIKVESTYKSDSVPVVGTDGVQLEEHIWSTIEVDYLEENLRENMIQTGMGSAGNSVPCGRYARMTVSVALKGRGIAYSATDVPESDMLFRIAGLSNTLDATVSMETLTYAPRSTGFESATVYAFAGGLRYIVVGCRAQLTSILMVPNQLPMATFDIWGVLVSDPTELALPSITYPADSVAPQCIANAGFTLNGYDPADFTSWELDMQTEIATLPRGNDADGHAGYEIIDYDPVFTSIIDVPPLASLNPFALRKNGTLFAWDIGPIGGTQYNQVTISGPAGRVIGQPNSVTDGIALMDLEIRCQNTDSATPDDAFSILFD